MNNYQKKGTKGRTEKYLKKRKKQGGKIIKKEEIYH